ncbi:MULTISPECIES: hypothetical protein [unclassified Burkholderia]|uniref:hypothetical protein n=1 Tax=unclassified Burkholderia TaxID=2613784 RepID=UPI00214FD0A1|nr:MULTISPECIES: hypothetical protein [unclassified Burkholderia]MCR4469865.1 hypothetical protein [Burkholderia sp. SCN-KJ]
MSTTLLCWCRDDEEVTEAAKKFKAERRYSGCRRAALQQVFGPLTGDDILVVTAHGTPLVFGEEDDSFTDFTAQQFSDALIRMVQGDWKGKLYMDICDGYNFAKNLRKSLSARFPMLQLFGCDGQTDMSVDLTKHKQVS